MVQQCHSCVLPPVLAGVPAAMPHSLPCRSPPLPACLSLCRHARSLSVFREGLEAFQKAYPFLVTTSLKANAARR